MNTGHESNSTVIALEKRVEELEEMVNHLIVLQIVQLPNIQWTLSPEALNKLRSQTLLAVAAIAPEYEFEDHE